MQGQRGEGGDQLPDTRLTDGFLMLAVLNPCQDIILPAAVKVTFYLVRQETFLMANFL